MKLERCDSNGVIIFNYLKKEILTTKQIKLKKKNELYYLIFITLLFPKKHDGSVDEVYKVDLNYKGTLY